MLLVTTFETVHVATKTIDNILSVKFINSLSCILTTFFGIWTPLNILVVIREGLTIPSLISTQNFLILRVFGIEKIIEHWMGNNYIATKLLAISTQTFCWVGVYVYLEPFLPTASAELVSATKLNWLLHFVTTFVSCLKICITNNTISTIILRFTGIKYAFILLWHQFDALRVK